MIEFVQGFFMFLDPKGQPNRRLSWDPDKGVVEGYSRLVKIGARP